MESLIDVAAVCLFRKRSHFWIYELFGERFVLVERLRISSSFTRGGGCIMIHLKVQKPQKPHCKNALPEVKTSFGLI